MTVLRENSKIFFDRFYSEAEGIGLYLDFESVDFIINDIDNEIDVVEFNYHKNIVMMKVICSDGTNDLFFTDIIIWNKFQKVNWAKEGF